MCLYLLTSFQDLTQRQKDQQEALWELLYTEVEYIKALYVIHDVSLWSVHSEVYEQGWKH